MADIVLRLKVLQWEKKCCLVLLVYSCGTLKNIYLFSMNPPCGYGENDILTTSLALVTVLKMNHSVLLILR